MAKDADGNAVAAGGFGQLSSVIAWLFASGRYYCRCYQMLLCMLSLLPDCHCYCMVVAAATGCYYCTNKRCCMKWTAILGCSGRGVAVMYREVLSTPGYVFGWVFDKIKFYFGVFFVWLFNSEQVAKIEEGSLNFLESMNKAIKTVLSRFLTLEHYWKNSGVFVCDVIPVGVALVTAVKCWRNRCCTWKTIPGVGVKVPFPKDE